MTQQSGKPFWAPKVSRGKIQRLYLSDASGIIDEELIDEVGWELWSRCDSILEVTAAHYGRVICPACGAVIEHDPVTAEGNREQSSPWNDDEIIHCARCSWNLPWKSFHQTYRGKQLFGANAVGYFDSYHKAYPQASAPNEKMLLIDQLIHAFHMGQTELGRPAGANLIEGSLKEVILFLDELASGPASAAGTSSTRAAWRRSLDGISWARLFLKPGEDKEVELPG